LAKFVGKNHRDILDLSEGVEGISFYLETKLENRNYYSSWALTPQTQPFIGIGLRSYYDVIDIRENNITFLCL
jgi:hypothetical protein